MEFLQAQGETRYIGDVIESMPQHHSATMDPDSSVEPLDSTTAENLDAVINLENSSPSRLVFFTFTFIMRILSLKIWERLTTYSHIWTFGITTRLIPDWYPYKYLHLSRLGTALQSRYWIYGSYRRGSFDIDRAIAAHNKSIQLTPAGHPDRYITLNDLGSALRKRYDIHKGFDDLEQAMHVHDEAYRLTPEGPDKATNLINLGHTFQYRFIRLDDRADLDRAISLFEEALQLTPAGLPFITKLLRLLPLYFMLLKRFQILGRVSDMNQAVSICIQMFQLMPDALLLKQLGFGLVSRTLQLRFERLGDVTDLDKAVSLQDKALEVIPDWVPNKQLLLSNLGSGLLLRFVRKRDSADIERAVFVCDHALRLTPNGNPQRYMHLSNLSYILRSRFDQSGHFNDLDRAISLSEEALRLIPDENLDRPMVLSNLGMALQRRFERSGQIADMDRALSSHDEALRLIPNGDPRRRIPLDNLGSALRQRFDRLGQLSDLDRAVSVHEEVAKLMPIDHHERPINLSNLGNALERRYVRLGRLADLDRAISAHSEAVQLTPKEHTHRPVCLENLSEALRSRFERLLNLADLEIAISAGEESVLIIPDGHAFKNVCLYTLGSSLKRRFDHLKQPHDIDRAIDLLDEALQLTSDDHRDKRVYLNSLGIALLTRVGKLEQSGDLDRAILLHTIAVRLTPEDHPRRHVDLSNLSTALCDRSKRTGDIDDLDQAIAILDESVRKTPDGHPDRAMTFHNLGLSLRQRFDKSGVLKDLEGAIRSFSASAKSFGVSHTHIQSAISWASLSLKILQLNPASDYSPLEACHVLVDLVPRLAWLGNPVERRYRDLSLTGSFISTAAAIACSVGDPRSALEWLEQGRSIVWRQVLNLRSPLDELEAHHPNLASDLRDVTDSLSQYASRSVAYTDLLGTNRGVLVLSPEQLAQEHRRLAEKYEELLNNVRQCPGFERFLLPKELSTLSAAARNGPVVVINTDSSRCDALILRNIDGSSHFDHVPLEFASLHKIRQARENLKSILDHGRIRQREPFVDDNVSVTTSIHRDLESHTRKSFQIPNHLECRPEFADDLEMLWLSIVKPVLDYLKFITPTPPNPDDLPHITWCPTGPLAFLPLHAAGCYGQGESKLYNKVYHHVVSSYTPSLSPLIQRQSALDFNSSDAFQGLVAISQPESSAGYASLPGARTEVDAIQSQMASKRFCHLNGSRATKETVLKAMEEYSWIHLACHGVQDRSDPTKSAFILSDGSLELRSITEKSLPQANFAFLSACQTATGDEKVPDEAVHLAAGMLLAGYRSVIGTMWSIRDSDGPVVAEEVYRCLIQDMRTENGQVAYALHKAVKVLRERVGENDFISWVPFIHLGI